MCSTWLGLLALTLWTAGVACQQCGVAGEESKIVGGQSVESLEFPWFVALVRPGDISTLDVWCGGSLITNRHVLSAAHCFDGESTKPGESEKRFLAVLGLINRCSHPHPEEVNIAKVRIHPDYDFPYFDISVFTLDKAVSFTPVCLPPRNYQPYGPAVVIGFGSTIKKMFLRESQYPCVLQKAQVDIYSKQQCNDSGIQSSWKHIPGIFCAGVPAGGVDSCSGDSGGPLMTVGKDGLHTVQGIVSFGKGCARKNLPGMYTEVSAYRDFIDSSVSGSTHYFGKNGF